MCPECREKFKIDLDDVDDGDLINCPICNLELTIVQKGKKFVVKTSKQKFLEDDSDFDEEDPDENPEEIDDF